jgi:hypothetical protein
LFCSYNKDLSKYLDGIDKLFIIINFFQQNTSLFLKEDYSELIRYDFYSGKSEIEKANYAKITFEPVSLNIEQLNQMWSYLGSRYMPSVLYRMGLVTVQTSQIEVDSVIKNITINLWENDKDDVAGLLETVIHLH